MSGRWWERHPRWARVCLTLFFSVLALLLCEGIVRVFHLGPTIYPVYRDSIRFSDDPALRYELIPGAPDGEERINSDGLRDREHTREKPPGVVRVECIGDSVCYGYGVTQKETLASRLAAHLVADSSRSYETFNLGVTGYDILQVAENLKVKGLRYHPDLVVYAYCLNDVDSFSEELFRLHNQMTAAQYSLRQYVLGHSGGWLARHCRLFALGLYVWQSTTVQGQQESRDPNGKDHELPHWSGGSSYYVRLYRLPRSRSILAEGMKKLGAISREAGVPVLVVIYPSFDNMAEYPCAEAHAVITEAAAAEHLNVLDLLPMYEKHWKAGDHDLNRDGLHPNPHGHDLAAAAIAKACLPLLDRRADKPVRAAAGTVR